MFVVLVALAAAVGLAIGSFLNVVIWRVPRGESVVSPPSHCPSCDTRIAGRDNVPLLSWLLLRARCRQCGAHISARYPAVELSLAVLYAGLVWRFQDRLSLLPALGYFCAVGVALALIDLSVQRLPNALTIPSYPLGAALLVLDALTHGSYWRLVDAAIGMAALYAFYFVLAVLKPGGMGFGDVKLAGVIGLYLGYLGWGEFGVGAFLAFLLGGIGGSALMLSRRAVRKTKIPFGPYMVAGALIAVFAGHWLATGYLHALGAS
jgi:leader peptidase (prepilin peptidase)/N-methyltransferase